MEQFRSERSLGELFADLSKDTSNLVRQEVELAKIEMSKKVSRIGKDIVFLTIGGVIAFAGFLGIGAAIIIGLAMLGVPWWLSALIVGLAVAGIGYFLIQKGLGELKKEDLAPKQTLETIKEDVEWAKEQTK